MELEEYDKAEQHYRDAIALNPKHPKPYFNLACLYSIEGRKDEAFQYLAEALNKANVLRWDAAHDPDLAPLRDDPRFQEIVQGASPPQQGSAR